MRFRPWRWLWGLLPLALIALAAIVLEREQVETDLNERARQALGASGLTWASTSFEGRDAVISGRTVSERERERASDVLSGTFGVRIVNDRAELYQKIDPFVWLAKLQDGVLKLRANVPSQADRATIMGIARATFPRHKIEDGMDLARGAPPSEVFLSGVSLGLKLLARLSKGRVYLVDNQLKLQGRAADVASYRAITQALASMPAGIELSDNSVRRPKMEPFTWSAEKSPDALLLEGYFDSEKALEGAVALAREAFAGAKLNNRAAVADGAPGQWWPAADAALRALAQLNEGRIEIHERTVRLTGTAQKQETADRIRETLGDRLPKDYTAAVELDFIDARPPRISPFTWSAVKGDRQTIRIEGHVPGEDARARLIAEATRLFADHDIDDRTSIARGVPEGLAWADAAAQAMRVLARLTSGRVALSDGALGIDGQAATVEHYGRIMALGQGDLPDGMTLASRAITPARVEEARWFASAVDGRLTLSGHVPSEEVRKALVADARSRFPGGEIVDEMVPATGLPLDAAAWTSSLRRALDTLLLLGNGRAELDGTELMVRGDARHRKVLAEARRSLEQGLPEGLVLDQAIRFAPPPEPDLAWRVRLRDGQLVLAGEVLDAEAGNMLVRYARRLFPGREIVDEMSPVGAASSDWPDVARTALRVLALLGDGAASIDGQMLTLSGEVDGQARRALIRETLITGLPDTYRGRSQLRTRARQAPALSARDVESLVHEWADSRPPLLSPFEWSARRGDDGVVLEGGVPDDKAREALLAAARATFGDAAITDEMTDARGAPRHFADAARYGLARLAGIDEGRVTLSDSRLRLRGETGDEAEARALELDFGAKLPDGFSGEADVAFREAAVRTVSPYTFAARREGNRVVLEGHAPDEAALATYLSVTHRFFDADDVENNIALAAGAPESFNEVVTALLARLGRLEHGEVAVRDNAVAISGEAKPGEKPGGVLSGLEVLLPRHMSLRNQVRFTGQAQREETDASAATLSPSPEPTAEGSRAKSGEPLETVDASAAGRTRSEDAVEAVQSNAADTAGTQSARRQTARSGTQTDAPEPKSDTGVSDQPGGEDDAQAQPPVTAGSDAAASEGSAISRVADEQRDDRTTVLAEAAPSDAAPEFGAAPGLEMDAGVAAAPKDGVGDGGEVSGTERANFAGDERHPGADDAQALRLADPTDAYADEDTAAPVIADADVAALSTRAEESPAALRSRPGKNATSSEQASAGADPGVDIDTVARSEDAIKERGVCESVLNSVATRGMINFEKNSAALSPDSHLTLIRLAQVAGRCENASIRVAGHTDSDGTRSYNQDLSFRRATAVRTFLVDKGISTKQVEIVAYGETRPLAPNTTSANKAANRRIEFVVNPDQP